MVVKGLKEKKGHSRVSEDRLSLLSFFLSFFVFVAENIPAEMFCLYNNFVLFVSYALMRPGAVIVEYRTGAQ